MGYHFKRVLRDKNHISIVGKLKRRKYGVVDLAAVGSSVPDIIVSNGVTTALVEIKMSDGWFYLAQLEFLATWPGIAGFAETLEDVLDLMEHPETKALSVKERQAILKVVAYLREEVTQHGKKRDTKQPRVLVTKFKKLYEIEIERLPI